MITLFIDTSTETLTIALFKDDVLLSTSITSSNEHSKYAMTEIEKNFNDNNIKPKDINRIMIVNGPGSFTGIRIGVTIAKVYAWACDIKVIPISTLRSYAITNTDYDYYVSMLDARRNYVYAGIYDKNYNEIMKDCYISKDDLINEISKLKNKLIIGDTLLDNYDVVKNSIDVTRVYNFYKNDDGINAHSLNPVYLKKTEAEEKLGDICDKRVC